MRVAIEGECKTDGWDVGCGVCRGRVDHGAMNDWKCGLGLQSLSQQVRRRDVFRCGYVLVPIVSMEV